MIPVQIGKCLPSRTLDSIMNKETSQQIDELEHKIKSIVFRGTVDIGHWQGDSKAVFEITIILKSSPSLASHVASQLAKRINDRSPLTAYLAIKLLSRCMRFNDSSFRRQVTQLALIRVSYLAVPNVGTHPRLQRIAAVSIRRWSVAYGSEESAFLAAAEQLARKESGAASRTTFARLLLAGPPSPLQIVDSSSEAQRLARIQRVVPQGLVDIFLPPVQSSVFSTIPPAAEGADITDITGRADRTGTVRAAAGSPPSGPSTPISASSVASRFGALEASSMADPGCRTQKGESDSEPNPARAAAPSPGPAAPVWPREPRCRDVPCLALLVLAWAAWGLLGWAVVSYGCPDQCNDPRQMVRCAFQSKDSVSIRECNDPRKMVRHAFQYEREESEGAGARERPRVG